MNEDNNQLTLSYELLVLLQWLIEYEPEQLRELITSAFDNGLENDLKKIKNNPSGYEYSESLQNSIVDFFGLFEILLHEIYNERATKRVMEKKLMPAIDHIDTTECDTQTVQDSIEKATSKFEQEPGKNPQELLFKELLKSWKPSKKTVSN